jgi:hypothetical protein
MNLRSIKFLVFGLASALAAVSDAGYDVALTYRGRLRKNGSAPQAEESVDMTFRLYGKKGDSEAAWSKTVPGVRVDREGLFQVSLSGDGLAEAIDAGRVCWIGVTIADGKEQYPRQQLLSAPAAEKASIADSLLSSPAIGTASVETAKAKTLTAGSLDVGGSTTLPGNTSPVSMSVKVSKSWFGVPVKGSVGFFSRANPRDLGTKPCGDTFGHADENCVALFTTEGSDVMPGLAHFVKKGASIRLGAAGLPAGTPVRCRVYPIGVE